MSYERPIEEIQSVLLNGATSIAIVQRSYTFRRVSILVDRTVQASKLCTNERYESRHDSPVLQHRLHVGDTPDLALASTGCCRSGL
jgi:hypothetical protein